MCIIIDSCIAGDIFSDPSKHQVLIDSLKYKRNILVCGGELFEEIKKNRNYISFISMLDRQGSYKFIDSSLVSIIKDKIAIKCVSNDFHVIALALASGARILCSHDNELGKDFKNKNIISSPNGKVYKSNKHYKVIEYNNRFCGGHN